MRTYNPIKTLILSAALVAMTTGVMACAPDGTTQINDTDEVAFATFNLELDDGGFDPTDADFGSFEDEDPSAFAEESSALEEPAIDAEIDALAADADLDPSELERYEIRLMWGQRRFEPGTPMTDWSGSVSTNAGALRVIRTIRFEENDGLEPRDNPRVVDVSSRTTVHNDGLRLRLVVPATPLVEAAGGVAMLRIQLGSVDIAVSQDRLRHLVRAQRVDDLGNGFSIVAFRHTPCPKGGVAGHWRKMSNKGGVFGGNVLDSNGDQIGRLAGIWGTRANGDNRIFGLFVKDGAPAGLVRGTWKRLPNKDGSVFRMHWVTANGEHKGMIRGFSKHAENRPAGRFMGLWAEKGCNAENEPGPTVETPETTTAPDLCSADGICVAEPSIDCAGDDCTDMTDEPLD
ncbi:MAG: hypothetical protein ACI9WU_004690 [Myxococcota bacterium]|jgi:hypothetical protein